MRFCFIFCRKVKRYVRLVLDSYTCKCPIYRNFFLRMNFEKPSTCTVAIQLYALGSVFHSLIFTAKERWIPLRAWAGRVSRIFYKGISISQCSGIRFTPLFFTEFYCSVRRRNLEGHHQSSKLFSSTIHSSLFLSTLIIRITIFNSVSLTLVWVPLFRDDLPRIPDRDFDSCHLFYH